MSFSSLPGSGNVVCYYMPVDQSCTKKMTGCRVDFNFRICNVNIRLSLWVLIAVVLLCLSNILYVIAFSTNSWGILSFPEDISQEGTWYGYGLWQECQRPVILCFNPSSLATSWYSATTAFAVLGLFGNILAFSLLLGYIFEKLLDFDECMIITWTAICFATGVFVLLSVTIFGSIWPSYHRNEYPGSRTELSYSFAFAATTVVLQILSGIMGILELKTFVPGPPLYETYD